MEISDFIVEKIKKENNFSIKVFYVFIFTFDNLSSIN